MPIGQLRLLYIGSKEVLSQVLGYEQYTFDTNALIIR